MIFRIFSVAVLSFFVFLLPIFSSIAVPDSQPDDLHQLSINELIAILNNNKASGSTTLRALKVVAERKETSAIPSIIDLLGNNRSDCSSFECVGMDMTNPALQTLQAMGSAAKPAVIKIVKLLEVNSGVGDNACFSRENCAKPIYETLKIIGPGAAEAVPALMTLVKENATHPGQNDFREALFDALGGIGPDATAAVPLLLNQVNQPNQSGSIISQAIKTLSQIAPNNPSVFQVIVKAIIHPRSFGLYNSSDNEILEKTFLRKTEYTETDMKLLATELKTKLDSSDQFQLLSERRMRLICDVIMRNPKYSSITLPALTHILEAYPANGAVSGSDIVIKTLGGFGSKAAEAVPALTKKVLDSGGSVYREEAVTALKAIGTPEAMAVIADYNAGKWRS